jgi:predicted DsbA family dithiol-disulfide isomerase
MPPLKLEVWSDIACPWCYVGKRRLEGALEQFAHASEVELIWRAFELDPGAKAERPRDVSHVEFIARKYGMSIAQAQKSTDHLVQLARAEGLSFDFVNIRSGNTFDAHRLVHLGHERGVQDAVQERMMKAYFEQAQLMSDHGTLVRLAGEAGLDVNEVTDLLAGDTYAAAVRADEAQARELGITGVPCFVFDRKFAVSGAQSREVLLNALQQAWSQRAPATDLTEGAVCGPDGC